MKPKTKVVFARLTIDECRELSKMAKSESRTDGNMLSVMFREALEARKSREV